MLRDHSLNGLCNNRRVFHQSATAKESFCARQEGSSFSGFRYLHFPTYWHGLFHWCVGGESGLHGFARAVQGVQFASSCEQAPRRFSGRYDMLATSLLFHVLQHCIFALLQIDDYQPEAWRTSG